MYMIMKQSVHRLLIVFLFLGTCFVTGHAQTMKQWLSAADTCLSNKDYYSAYQYYGAALQYDPTYTEAWYKRGIAAFNWNNYDQAVYSFDKALDLDTAVVFPDLIYQLARAYQYTANYKKAVEYYEAFVDNPPANVKPELVNLARKGALDSRWASAAALRQKNVPQPKNLGEGINSSASDFGAIYKGDTLYYSSYQFIFEKDKLKPKRNLVQLMQVNPGTTEGVLISGPFNSDEKHTAYNTFSLDDNTMYYCLCEYKDKTKIRCDIYKSRKDSLGLWGPAQELSINVPGKNTTEPAVGINPQTGEEILYFASDRDHPDAKGGSDIYYGTIQPDGDVADVKNFTEINSAGDDVTPFYHRLSRQFFFSSNGYLSFGGFDIFMSYFDKGEWTTPSNIGLSANSSYNEYNYAINEEGTKAVFDSDRPGSQFIDHIEEVCCNDLYQIELDNELNLDVYTFNALDSTPLFGVEVQLDQLDVQRLPSLGDDFDLANLDNMKDYVIDSLIKMKPDTNHYRFELNRQYVYHLSGNKSGFQPDEETVNPFELDPGTKEIRKELYLMPDYLNLQIIVLDEADSTDLLGATVELVQISKDLDSVLIFKETKEFSNVFGRSVNSNFSYYINATRPGYEGRDLLLEITPELIAEIGRDITVEVYLPRTGFPDFLPLSLYFDNAIPYDRNYSETTSDNYQDLCEAYAQKQQEFYEKFSEGLSEEDKFSAQIYYRDFFQREVTDGLRKLKDFSNRLELYLKLGNSLTVQVRGYTSPIANSRYNEKLSLRRIKSIENFFANYDNQKLKKYLENGQLVIEEAAFGEDRVGKDIPENIKTFLANLGDLGGDASITNSKDRRMSVYSLLACVERRVEIVEVKTNFIDQNPDNNLLEK